MQAQDISIIIISMSVILTAFGLLFKKINKCQCLGGSCTQDIDRAEKVAESPQMQGLFNILLSTLTPRRRNIAVDIVKDVKEVVDVEKAASSKEPETQVSV